MTTKPKEIKHFESADKMSVLFIGHGSPMNAIEDTELSDYLTLTIITMF